MNINQEWEQDARRDELSRQLQREAQEEKAELTRRIEELEGFVTTFANWFLRLEIPGVELPYSKYNLERDMIEKGFRVHEGWEPEPPTTTVFKYDYEGE